MRCGGGSGGRLIAIYMYCTLHVATCPTIVNTHNIIHKNGHNNIRKYMYVNVGSLPSDKEISRFRSDCDIWNMALTKRVWKRKQSKQ